MQIIKGVLVLILFGWFLIVTVAAMGMPPLEHKFLAWAIAALGPVVVIAGLWEVCSKVFSRGARL